MEIIGVIVYFIAFVAYQFAFGPETEWAHWLTLVLLPFLGLYLLHRRSAVEHPFKRTLASVGLRRGHLTDGLAWVVPFGLLLSTATLWFSRSGARFLEMLETTQILWALPLAFVFLLATAAFTEEFFFRGIVQGRLENWLGTKSGLSGWRAKMLAVVGATVVFATYHVPYAYLSPHWPSHGDLGEAIRLASIDGTLGGLVLGLVFVGARGNLVAVILVHALIDLLPAVTMIRFG
ncbi:MAG TPA: CPBP family intramembrane glutamic endopeptidase [Gemmatimonadota bacterium]|nr:CPBP family intramembrane glutamic endopeptidase [Gemmatimonadota bacterium]